MHVTFASQVSEYGSWVFGVLGAITRVCLLHKTGQTMSRAMIVATLISGTVCAGTGSATLALLVPGLGALSLGMSAYISGMLGMALAEYVVSLRFAKGGKVA